MTKPTAGPFRAGADTGTSVPGDRAWLAFAALYLGAVAAIVVVYGESSDLPWMNHDAANVL